MTTTVANGALEDHSVKHTATEMLGGPANRVWSANVEWSGATVVEAGIHNVDLMRFWCGDIAWVEATYVHRDEEDVAGGGDNPYAYRVALGFESGCIGNLLVSRLRRVFHSDAYEAILWTHGIVKFEGSEVAAYHYDGAYPPTEPPKPEELRHTLDVGPRVDSTEEISRAFVRAVRTGDPGKLPSTFAGSMNSLAAVLAANVSDRLDGERVYLRDFMFDDRYAAFRTRPHPNK